MHRHRHVILHLIAKFQIVISIFFKMAAGSHTGFDLGNVRSAIAGFSFFIKIAIFARAVFVVFRHKDGAIMKSYLGPLFWAIFTTRHYCCI